MRILFTPAGDTDPVRGFRDGAILHILRHYTPVDKVILFLTKDMEEKEKESHCYTKGIATVAQDIPLEMINSGIIEPHKYEKLTQIQEAFDEVYDAYPEDTQWLLNVSSGTPQIKTVMALLALDYPRTKAIQVDSPMKGSNRDNHPNKENDMLEMIECNEDRIYDDMPNRCSEPPLLLLKKHSLKRQIISLVKNYEYAGALQLVKQNSTLFSEDTKKLLQHAVYRRDLMWKEANKVIASYQGSPLIQNPDDFSEYFQVMEMRQRKKQYPEFIVKLSPVLMNLGLKYMDVIPGFQLSRCGQERNHIFFLDRNKMNDNYPGLVAYMETALGKTLRSDYLYFNNIVMICEYLQSHDLKNDATHDQVTKIFGKLRLVEERTRNLVAHEITNLSDKKIKELTTQSLQNRQGIPGGLDAKAIMTLLHEAVRLIRGRDIRWTYDDLNDKIINSLRENS